jgi:hypothetical protein
MTTDKEQLDQVFEYLIEEMIHIPAKYAGLKPITGTAKRAVKRFERELREKYAECPMELVDSMIRYIRSHKAISPDELPEDFKKSPLARAAMEHRPNVQVADFFMKLKKFNEEAL